MRLLAIDPGTTESGWAVLENGAVLESGIDSNESVLQRFETILSAQEYRKLYGLGDTGCAIEMIASYGMPVGREVFETCVWIGRFCERWYQLAGSLPALVYRQQVKLHLCGSPRAKDPNVRQALLDLLGPQGTKKVPGPTYGVKSHAWAALGVAVTAARVAARLRGQAQHEALMGAF